MIGALEAICARFWGEMLTHLWQTALVWGVIWLAVFALRNAPGKIVHRLWRVALLKLLVPVSAVGWLLERLAPAEWGAALGRLQGHFGGTLGVVGGVLDPMVVRSLEFPTVPGIGAWLMIATAMWILGSGVFFIGLLRQARDSRRLLRRSTPLETEISDLPTVVDACTATGTPTRCVRVSTTDTTPVTTGLLRSRIVIPRGLAVRLSPDELRGVLLHEDAHRRRRDPAWNALQRLLLGWFFFFPPFHLVIRRLRETAEYACDEAAIEGGTAPSIYAMALARTVDFSLSHPVLSSAASGGGRSLLRRRFHRLTTLRRNRPMRRTRWIAGGAVVAALALSLLPLALQAETPPSTVSSTAAQLDADQGSEDFDVAPKPVNAVPPKYPDVCRKAQVSGSVHVEVTVTDKGLVIGARVIKTVDDCPALGKAALEASRQWTFEPAMKDGRPVAARIVIPFQFKLH